MAKTTNILYLEQLFHREAHEMYQDENLLAEAFELFRKAANNPLLGEHFEQILGDKLAGGVVPLLDLPTMAAIARRSSCPSIRPTPTPFS